MDGDTLLYQGRVGTGLPGRVHRWGPRVATSLPPVGNKSGAPRGPSLVGKNKYLRRAGHGRMLQSVFCRLCSAPDGKRGRPAMIFAVKGRRAKQKATADLRHAVPRAGPGEPDGRHAAPAQPLLKCGLDGSSGHNQV